MGKQEKLRVGLLTPSASRLGGGVFEAVVSQAAMLQAAGATPVIFALEDAHSVEDRDRFGEVPVYLGKVRGPRQIGYSPELGQRLAEADLDILHLHGIWTSTSHLAARWAVRSGKPCVVSPHGMLDPWITGRGRTKKLLARLGYEKRNWKHARLFHALTQAEADDIRRETGRDTIAIIPNAVDLLSDDLNADVNRSGIVYLGRIHPKKNINGLIRGWQLLANTRGNATPPLTLAGWGDAAHIATLKELIEDIGDSRLTFIGPVYGELKQSLLSNASALALPSFSEGLPMVILESWAVGTPTIMSRHCNLSEGFAVGAAQNSGTEPEEIARALQCFLNEDISAIQRRRTVAREFVAEHFSPQVVSDAWFAIYKQLASDRSLR